MRIGAVAQASGKRFDGTLAAPYLSDDHLKLLEQIERGPAAVALAQGNAMVAKKLRQGFSRLRSAVSGEGRSWKP
jgi:hypothetical protein